MVALPLNGTRIAFLHPDDTGLAAPCAVQIDMKSKTYSRDDDVETIYAAKKDEITELVLKLVIAHTCSPLPKHFVVDEEEYTITAARMPWVYGKQKLLLTWGDDRVLPCDDKWCFLFEIRQRSTRT